MSSSSSSSYFNYQNNNHNNHNNDQMDISQSYISKGDILEFSAKGRTETPYSIVILKNGNIVLANYKHGSIQIFSMDKKFIKGKKINIGNPTSLFVDNLNNLYVGTSIGKIIIFKDILNSTDEIKTGETDPKYPMWDISSSEITGITGLENYIYIVDNKNVVIKKYTNDGQHICDLWKNKFKSPFGINITKNKNFIVSDIINNNITILTEFEIIIQFGSFEDQFKEPKGIAISEGGSILICDSGNNRIKIYTEEGKLIQIYGSSGSSRKIGEFNNPQSISLYNKKAYIADTGNDRIQIIPYKF